MRGAVAIGDAGVAGGSSCFGESGFLEIEMKVDDGGGEDWLPAPRLETDSISPSPQMITYNQPFSPIELIPAGS